MPAAKGSARTPLGPMFYPAWSKMSHEGFKHYQKIISEITRTYWFKAITQNKLRVVLYFAEKIN
jgi:hypothetical protein